jgi:hypothetical protein
MSEITLISNTGVQFHTFKTIIQFDKLRQLKFVYFEDVDYNRRRFWLEELIYLNENDIFVRKRDISKIPTNKNEQSSFDFRSNEIKTFTDGQAQVFEIGNISQVLKTLEGKWLPLPVFKNNAINQDFFGPIDWVRIFIKSINKDEIEVVLAIDTTLAKTDGDIHSPLLSENPQENKFKLCDNEDLILSYFDSLTNCQWVEEYVRSYFKFEEGDSQTKHIASFVYLMRFLRSLDEFPSLQLLSDNAGLIDVDMSVDIGNSHTCALLFENPNDLNFNLNKVKQLELIDLTQSYKRYNASFSTRLVFKQPDFGNQITNLNQFSKFKWPSFVRVGDEAERLINNADVDQGIRNESRSFHSSPKRYLWDSAASETDWHFYDDSDDIPKSVFLSGLSEQLKSDGTICTDGIFGTSAKFSRKSLMTFVFLELIAQASRQINSFEFRSSHGNTQSRRRLKRIIISCPTAMIREEQIALRQCANDAFILFHNFSKVINNDRKLSFENDQIEIIPSLRDLKFDESQLERRIDWIYDEATAAQILYLYGAIKHKFDGNAELFFKLYGKTTLADAEDDKILTIGSLDIGAGTSDLMICNYSFNNIESTTITPTPIYSESFDLAGDELLKNLIQEIIIEGKQGANMQSNCSGVILNKGIELNIPEMSAKINGFFGRNSAQIDHKAKMMRVSFINQIGIPIALKYLSIANEHQSYSKTLTFDELFDKNPPNQHLLEYFERYFGFKFQTLVWNLNPQKVNDIIILTYSKILEQISKIMHLYKCEIILLSGRPFSLLELHNHFLKFHPVNPNRIINLNNYWIGKWYPFSDNLGKINDPKSVVAVGSLLAMIGGKIFKLDRFRIDTTNLKNELKSTANFIGKLENGRIHDTLMSEDQDEAEFTVYDIPYHIGFKRVNSNNYPAKNLYTFQFNDSNIKEQLGLQIHSETTSINDVVENRKNQLRGKLPFKITIRREVEKDKEKLKIDYILDKEQGDISKMNFELKLQSLPNESGYWLDSGDFNLSID